MADLILSIGGQSGEAQRRWCERLRSAQLDEADQRLAAIRRIDAMGVSGIFRVVEPHHVAVTMLPPKERDIAMVFQSYALYPHMTVAENRLPPQNQEGPQGGDRRAGQGGSSDTGS